MDHEAAIKESKEEMKNRYYSRNETFIRFFLHLLAVRKLEIMA